MPSGSEGARGAETFVPDGALRDELLSYICLHGVRTPIEGGGSPAPVEPPARSPAGLPAVLERLRSAALPRRPRALAVDIYGTLLAAAQSEPGAAGMDESGATTDRVDGSAAPAFPRDMKARLRAIVASDHELSRAGGLPWPEVDAVSVFSRALGLDAEDAARACVAWECACNPASPLPGARAFLARCAAAGLPLGIVSNAQFYTPLFIEAAYGAPLFGPAGLGFDPDLAFWSFERLRAKPDPHMFRLLAKELRGRGVDASEACYIGNDALNDCAAAAAAGFMTVLFSGDPPSFKPRLGEPGLWTPPADALASSWERVEALIFGSAAAAASAEPPGERSGRTTAYDKEDTPCT